MGRKQCHTATYRNHWVRVRLKNGRQFVDRFIESTSTWCLFKEQGRIRCGDIDKFTPHRTDHSGHGAKILPSTKQA